ncbi:MAG: O-antigen ligase family protein [Rubrobacter sp.]|nr:O-antigen ligase family protein [Rubrobacter sp.]
MGGSAAGGYYAGGWTPVALVLAVLLLLVSLSGLPGTSRSLGPGLLAAALLVAYALWTLASLLWSPNAGDAWAGAGQTLLYLLVFLLALIFVSLGAGRRWVLAASALGPALVAAFTLFALDSRLGDLFEDGRLVGSVGYYNGQAAFLMIPFWIGIYLGGSRRLHPLVRGAVLGGAVLSASVASLAQSRGAMVALALSAAAFFLLSGKRLRGLIALGPVAVALFFAFPGLNGVYLASVEGGSMGAALADATGAVWIGAAGTALYGVAWGLADRWWRPSRGLVRMVGGVTLACIVGGSLLGGALVQERVGSPVEFAGDRWEAFKAGDTSGQDESRYLSASNNGRLPLWEVAWEEFKAQPLHGLGARNYEAAYYQFREEYAGYVRQSHSLPLEVIAELGAVGGVLFFGFLGVCVGRGLWRRFGNLSPEGKAQAGALLAALAYWFVHSSVEWFWQLPAVTLVAFVYLALLVAPWRGEAAETPRVASALGLGSAGIAALALVVVVPLFAANLYLQESRSAEDPESALAAVEHARTLNPLDSRLARREAEVALEAGEWDRVEASYEQAARLDPGHYGPHLLMASYHERRGEFAEALARYQRALELNPLQPELQQKVEYLGSLDVG